MEAQGEHRGDTVDVDAKRFTARACRGRPELAFPEIVEPEQLVGVPVLLVVVDQPRVRRRGDNGVEASGQIGLARIAVDHLGLPAAAQPCELLQPRQRVERVTADEVARSIGSMVRSHRPAPEKRKSAADRGANHSRTYGDASAAGAASARSNRASASRRSCSSRKRL
jgi:hypothetical protein